MILSSIIRVVFESRSRFLPALREATVGGHSSGPPVALSVSSAPAVAGDRPARPAPLLVADDERDHECRDGEPPADRRRHRDDPDQHQERKSTRLNSSHGYISYAVFC